MLTVELTCRSCEVDMSWVKGHATRRDVQMGRTTSEDKVGSDGADLMAVVGAASHRVPSEVLTSAKKRRELAKRTQQMMVNILLERQPAPRARATQGNGPRSWPRGRRRRQRRRLHGIC